MPLSAAQVKSLKHEPGKKETRIHDGLGLYLFIADKDAKYWRFKSRFQGKGILLSLGTYPTVSLAEARAKTLELVNLIKSGVNPAENRKAQMAAITSASANSFEVVAREWQAVKMQEFTEKSKYRTTHGLEKYVFPFIGGLPISEIKSPQIVDIARRMGIAKDELCGHGWRAIARTLLEEELKYPLPIIELQLAHGVKDVHGRAYNRTTFIKERHEIMQAWADYLDKLKKTATSTPAGKVPHD